MMNETNCIIRSAVKPDAESLSSLRLQIDGETQNMDREPGEAFIDRQGFEDLIKRDTEGQKNLFLVAVVHERIVGFSRCEGYLLKRFAHKIEFGICILKNYWGLRIGTNLLKVSLDWADSHEIKKKSLTVLETNEKAIRLYEKNGFKIEGILKNDRFLADGHYYNTLMIGRFID